MNSIKDLPLEGELLPKDATHTLPVNQGAVDEISRFMELCQNNLGDSLEGELSLKWQLVPEITIKVRKIA